jgi:hypothetical protein
MQAFMRSVQIKANSFKYILNEDPARAKIGITAAKILILKQKQVIRNDASETITSSRN